jgi:hypothetical protein
VGFAAVLASALALSAPAEERAFALLADNRLVGVAVPSGKVVARRRLGPKPRGRVEAGRMLARSDTRLFVLVQTGNTTDSVAVLDVRSAKIRARWVLEPGVRYRGIVYAGDRLHAYGGRSGKEIDTTNHIREQSAVLTQLDAANGQRTASTTIRPAEGHMWWIYRAAANSDATRITLSYHGGCSGEAPQLCTSGADWIDVDGQRLRRCELPTARVGCMEDVHGMVEPYGVGWIGTTGTESLVQYGRSGNLLRKLHSGIRRDHVMNFAFSRDRSWIYVISSCLYSHEGLRRVAVKTGTPMLVRGKICGEHVVVGRTALLVRQRRALEIRRPGAAQLRRRHEFATDVLDVIVTG